MSLGEGDTPLLPVWGPTLNGLAVGSIGLKAEHHNPTGSFKDRIATVAASLIRQEGLAGAVGTSSGNGGAAMAAYGARAGVPVVLFTVAGIVDGKLQQILAHGADVYLVSGMGTEGPETSQVAPTIAAMAHEQGWLPFLTGGKYLPAAMRGAETIAYELFEQRPSADVLYVPIGGGGLLASIYRGYRRLATNCPRLVGVQPSGVPTVRRALNGDMSPLPVVDTTISGLQVPVLFDDDTVEAIESTGGWLVEVSDQQAWDAQRLLATEEGVFVEPAGATALAGMLVDVADGTLGSDDSAVVILSGAGHKDSAAVQRLAANHPLTIPAGGIQDAFSRIRT